MTPPDLRALVDGPGWVGIMSQWVAWKVLHLPQFLGPEGPPFWLWQRGRTAPKGLKAIAGIGYKRSSAQARVLCQRWNLPYIALEDGFLRSSSLGVEGDTPMSMVVDPIGIHYLADRPSLLENILQAPDELTAPELHIARELIALMRSSGIGKYNNAPDLDPADALGRDKPLVLVVDQTAGDFSIPGGGLTDADFVRMLDAALAENPGADVRVRIHPDCIGGHKPSCLLAVAQARGVTLEARPVSWASLARRAQRVYIGTSQAGLEALIQGVPVTCFGAPFYAGWGLTDDRLATPRRLGRPTLEQLVAAAYVRYCRYVCPLTGQVTDALTVARQLARQKALDEAFAGPLTVLGVKAHKQHNIRRFCSSRWGSVQFAKDSPSLLPRIAAKGGKLLVWAAREPGDLQARARAAGVELWRLDDGFIRSHGLNAPVSLLLDRSGVHFDASQPSDLEMLLQAANFDTDTLAQAARLRERIVASTLRGGETLRAAAGQRRILVAGQSDLLARVRAAAPDAWIVCTTDQSGADQVVGDIDIGQVDEVHTCASVVGFDALLRGVRVVTYGTPFYAGWGLTEDRQALPRRTQRLTLDQLVAGTLLQYSRYADARQQLPCDVWHALTLMSVAERQPWSKRPGVLPLLNYVQTMLGFGRSVT